MLDLVLLVIVVAFFGVVALVVRFADRVVGPDESEA